MMPEIYTGAYEASAAFIAMPAVRMISQVFPNLCNHHGTLFGGEGMALMDKAAFIAASRHGRDSFVTARCERVDFSNPIYSGELVEAQASLTRVGRTSVDVEVKLWGEAPLTGERKLATTGLLTLVAAKRKTALPPLEPSKEQHSTPLDLEDDVLIAPALNFQDMIFPPQTNHYGTLFGGDALSIMGRAAYVLATRKAHARMVMASCSHSRFEQPVYEGEMVDVRADVLARGRTSIQITVELWAENLLTGDQRLAGAADYVMVAVDEAGHPTPLR